jgi:hypothetical protein
MLKRVISGGQTGADQAGWRAAKGAGIPTGGWMPKGFLTEAGPRPDFAELYGAREHDSAGYAPRTGANVRDSDFTLIFVEGKCGPGSGLTMQECRRAGRPFILVLRDADTMETPQRVAYALKVRGVGVLNVAGSRESKAPRVGEWLGIGEWAEAYLAEVFRLLREYDVRNCDSAPLPR